MILTDSVENRMMKVLAISNMGKNNSKGEEGGGEREREGERENVNDVWT